MMKLILLAASVIGIVSFSFGQSEENSFEKKGGSIGANFGFINNRLIDEGLSSSKLLFRGISSKFLLEYKRRSDKSNFNTAFEICSGKVKTRQGQIASQLSTLQLSLGYARKVTSFNAFSLRSQLYAGMQASSIIHYIESQELDNEDIIHTSGIYLTATQNFHFSASRLLQVQATLPAIAFVKRLILEGGLNEPAEANSTTMKILFDNGQVAFPRVLQINVEYLKRLSTGSGLSVKYRFNYFSSFSSEKLRLYSNEILFGFKFYGKK